MISIPFSYPKDKNLKLLVQLDYWFSRQKDFILLHNYEKVVKYKVFTDVFVTQAGEKYYSIRYEPNFLTPTLFIEKEPFLLEEKLKWHDYLVLFLCQLQLYPFHELLGIQRKWDCDFYLANNLLSSKIYKSEPLRLEANLNLGNNQPFGCDGIVFLVFKPLNKFALNKKIPL